MVEWLESSWLGIISISLEISVFRNLLVSCSSPLVENCSSIGFIPDGILPSSRLEFLASLDALGLLVFS